MGILIETFENKFDTLTSSERSALVALDNQPELLLAHNLTDLAELIYSSNSTLIRLAQKLGFSGFSEFKIESKHIITSTKYFKKSTLIDSYKNFFDDFLSTYDSTQCEYFAQHINEAESVFCIGLGLTKPIAEYMCKKLYQLDKPASYIYETHQLDLMPNLAKRNALVIFISMSGETKSLLNCARKVKETGATLLSITNSPSSSLNRLTKANLSTQMSENVYHNYDITSRAFPLMMIDLTLDVYLNKYLK